MPAAAGVALDPDYNQAVRLAPGAPATMKKTRKPRPKKSGAVTLRALADHVGLTPGTVSSVLNGAPSSRSIPERTKNRIMAAATELNYRPNFFAQSLRKKRTYTIGVIVEEIGDAYGSLIISGIEQYLRSKNFFFLTVVHRHDPDLLDRYAQILLERGVEGFITIDMQLREGPSIPTVAVAGHKQFPGVTNIVLDHRHAASVALQHLVDLGHKKIAFMRGASFSSDSDARWSAICEVAKDLKIEIKPELTVRSISTTQPHSLAIPSRNSSSSGEYPSPPCSLTTICRHWAQFARSRKRACVCPTTSRSWASTISKERPTTLPASRLYVSL